MGPEMFFTFDQNNSGGDFVLDEDKGLTHFVIIEADSAEEANATAEGIGIYWDGCDSGVDCPCCGDRWHPARPDDRGTAKPEWYGKPVSDIKHKPMKWMPEGREAAVHYKNGTIEWF